jgi:hypothetical protein
VGGQIWFSAPQVVGAGTHNIGPRQHMPLMHWVGAGQAAPPPQPLGSGTHLPMLQTASGGQGFWRPQPCAVHMPATHVEPGGQLSQVPIGPHAPFSQLEPGGQGAPLVQLSSTQIPSAHSDPGGHGWVVHEPLTG